MGSDDSSGQGVVLSSTVVLREGARRLLRALVRSNYYGRVLPPIEQMAAATRLPPPTIEQALLDLENEDVVARNGQGLYESAVLPDVDKAGEIAFLLNANFFHQWNSMFHDFLIGFEQTMHEEHFEVLFRTDFGMVERKMALLKEFHESGVSGVVFCSYAEPELRQYVVEHEIAAIILGNATIHQQELGCVCSDNMGGMSEVVRFLAENGHQHIAYYTPGVSDHDGYQERWLGYEMGMRKMNLTPQGNLVFTERHNDQLAKRAAKVLQSLRPMPTAVACATDRDAIELSAELKNLGVAVPGEVSVTGWGDGVYGQLNDPPLTTVNVHSETMGQVAAHYLLNETQGHQIPIRMMLPTQIVIRDSVVGLEYADDELAPSSLSRKTSRVKLPEDEQALPSY